MMRILFAGDFDPAYNRTKTLLKGLSRLEEVQVEVYTFNKKTFNLEKFKKLESTCSAIFLPSFSHSTANLVLRKASKPVLFDPLISKYLTKVFDYKQVSRYGLRAFKNFKKDQVPMRKCAHLIADTEEHKVYFHNTFGIPLSKISVLPVGVDCEEYAPKGRSVIQNKFIVGFYGGFIPLQGVKYILEAASQLKSIVDIEFRLIGTGFEFEKMKQLAKDNALDNVKFLGWIDAGQLPQEIAEFDVCLGIFGDTIKAQLVIPNKIFHYAAMAKPIVTMDTSAIKELFTDQKNIVLIEAKTDNLSQEILRLRDSATTRNELGKNARSLVETTCDSSHTALRLIEIIKAVL